MVTAASQVQWRLLDVQAHDTRLAQIAHRRGTLPELAEAERVTARLKLVVDDLVAARTIASDIERERAKAEADVEQVRQRAARDTARLHSGQGTSKDLLSLQNEIASLAERQSVLEDVELEVMERLEVAQGRIAEVEAEQQRLDAELAEVAARRDAAFAELDDEARSETAARADAVAGVPADLLALYEKVRGQAGGVGAARLYQGRCEGCRLELNTIDLGRLRTAADDEVLRCEECRRILVRTPDSGL